MTPTLSSPIRSLVAVAALAVAAAVPAAADAKPRNTFYDVTFETQMTESWKYDGRISTSCGPDGNSRCDEDMNGAGSTKISLRTPTPKRVSVTSGVRGTQPMIVYAIDSGIPLKGSIKRSGTYTDVYSGFWDAANTDFAAPTGDCGDHVIKTDVALGWSGKNQLFPLLNLPDLLDCPTGPTTGFDYTPDAPPTLTDVVAQVDEGKFGRTRQFRVSGSKTWAGTIVPMNRTDPDDYYVSAGQSETRWTWEATFRMVKKKKARRRG